MTQPFIAKQIDNWEPSDIPHCSNCRRAKVHGEPDDPKVRCEAGHGRDTKSHGRELNLTRLLREKLPLGFRAASECPDWEE